MSSGTRMSRDTQTPMLRRENRKDFRAQRFASEEFVFRFSLALTA